MTSFKDKIFFNISQVPSALYRMLIQLFRNITNQDSGLLFAFFMVILVWALNVNAIPWMDAAAEIETKEMPLANGDFNAYLARNTMDHPLGRIITLTLFYKIFGSYAFAATLPGMLLNLVSVFSIFSLSKQYGNINCARIAAILLACDSVFIGTSLHTLPDHFLAAVLLVACYAYASNRMLLWAISLAFAVLTKETALLFVCAFIGQWIISIPFIRKEHKKINYMKLLIPISSFVIYLSCTELARSYGVAPWTFAGHNGFRETVEILLHFDRQLAALLFGNYFEHLNWLHLTVFNFQWLINGFVCWWFVILTYTTVRSIHTTTTINSRASNIAYIITLITLAVLLSYLAYFLLEWKQYIIAIVPFVILPIAHFLSFFIVYSIAKIKADFFESPFLAIMLFVIAYILLVLTYRTWANPRYVLPVTVFMLIPAAFCIDFLSLRIGKITRYFLYAAGFLVMAVRFFASIDPVTDGITFRSLYLMYEKPIVQGETVYMSNSQGLDSIVYNGQYIMIIAKRSTILRSYADFDAEDSMKKINCGPVWYRNKPLSETGAPPDLDMCCHTFNMLTSFTSFDPKYLGMCNR